MKTCLGCRHFNFSTAERGYSEYTPGCNADLSCEKGVWLIDLYDESEASLYRKLNTAIDCEHYEFAAERAE